MTIRVGVLGAAGRMGTTVCAAVQADSELELVAAIDPEHAGIQMHGLTVAGEIGTLSAKHADVAVDFTNIESARANLDWCSKHDVHAVVGTTGFNEEELTKWSAIYADSSANCIIAPNFAIGAVLMMKFAELAAPHFETAEIIELHHDRKVDAPSGTARLTAERMAAASDKWGTEPTTESSYVGVRGGVGPAGLHIHSVRLRGLVAHQEVLFGTTGQMLTIRHDSYDRNSFMPGVLLAIKCVDQRSGLTVGIEPLLGI